MVYLFIVYSIFIEICAELLAFYINPIYLYFEIVIANSFNLDKNKSLLCKVLNPFVC